MEIKMEERKEIQDKLQSLTLHAALTDQFFENIKETLIEIKKSQDMMVQIMSDQSRQKEKNKGFDSSIHRLNSESVENRKAIADNKDSLAVNREAITVNRIKPAAVGATSGGGVAGLVWLIAEYAPKLFGG